MIASPTLKLADELSFGQPHWFWALAVLPVLLALFIHSERLRAKVIGKLVAARLQDRLTGTLSLPRRRLRWALMLLGLGALILALAQPRWGFSWQQSQRKGRDVIIAIDTSKSMLGTDLSPNRLTRAKLAAQDLISTLNGDRVGLVAFAGNAFLQAPLTVDYSAVLGSLNELDTDIIPQGGTNIAAALKTAAEAFGKGESDHRALILFTDGEDLEEAGEKTATELKAAMRIFTVGLGSPEGSLLPMPRARGGEFIKDAEGQIVKSHLDETRLKKIAEATGGFYVRLQNSRAEADKIVKDGLGKMTETDIDAKLSRQPLERYQWPLGAGLLLLAGALLIGERKSARSAGGVRALALLLGALLLPATGSAKNPGVQAYEQKDYKAAQDTFSQQLQSHPNSPGLHFDLGTAAYKNGDYDTALNAFSRALSSDDPQLRSKAEYNLANTLFHRGSALKDKEPKIQEWNNALQHYEQALKTAPDNKDAKYNRDLIKNLIAQLQKKDPPPPEQDKDDKKDKKDKDDKKDQQDKKDENKQDKDKSKGDQKDSKDQDSKEQNPDDKDSKGQKDDKKDPSKDGKQQDKKDDKKDPSEQDPKDGKDGKKDDQKQQPKDGKQGDPNKPNQPSNAQNSQEPKTAPEPDPAAKKPTGDLKSAPQFNEPGSEAEQQAEELQAAAEGKMTERQANNLLDSLKSEDQRVQWGKPKERKANGQFFRDW